MIYILSDTLAKIKNTKFVTMQTTYRGSHLALLHFKLKCTAHLADLVPIEEHEMYADMLIHKAYLQCQLNQEENFVASLFIAMLSLERLQHAPAQHVLDALKTLIDEAAQEKKSMLTAKYLQLLRKRNKQHTMLLSKRSSSSARSPKSANTSTHHKIGIRKFKEK